MSPAWTTCATSPGRGAIRSRLCRRAAARGPEARHRGVFSRRQLPFQAGVPQRMGRLPQDDLAERSADFRLASRVLALQTAVLGQLMGDTVAARLLDSSFKVGERQEGVPRCRSSTTRCSAAIWSDLKGGQDIPLIRRNLQREHVEARRGRAAAPIGLDARRCPRAAARRGGSPSIGARGCAAAFRVLEGGAARTSHRRQQRSMKR